MTLTSVRSAINICTSLCCRCAFYAPWLHACTLTHTADAFTPSAVIIMQHVQIACRGLIKSQQVTTLSRCLPIISALRRPADAPDSAGGRRQEAMATHRQLPCCSWVGRGGSLPRRHDVTGRRRIVGRSGCKDFQHLAGAEGGDEGRRRDLRRRRRRHRVGLRRVCAAAGASAKCDPAQRQAPAGCSLHTSCAAKDCMCHWKGHSPHSSGGSTAGPSATGRVRRKPHSAPHHVQNTV